MNDVVIGVAMIMGAYGLSLLHAILKRLVYIEGRAEGFHDEAVAEVDAQTAERSRIQQQEKVVAEAVVVVGEKAADERDRVQGVEIQVKDDLTAAERGSTPATKTP